MLRVHLVGELRLDVDGRPLPAIPSRRARSLLGWLALHPGLHPRSRVAAVFWPDVLEHSSRGSLRTTLTTTTGSADQGGLRPGEPLPGERDRPPGGL